MSGRHLKIVFGGLAVLLLAYAVARPGGERRRGDRGSLDVGLAVWGDVGLIRVIGPGPGDSVRLSRETEGWRVNGFRADSAAVRELILALDSARTGRLVARSASNHARLGVATDSTRRIEAGPAGDPSLVFLLGSAGPEGHYVRSPESDEVFVVESSALRRLRGSTDDWRDRRIAALDTASVVRIRVRRGTEDTDLVRTAGPATGWLADGTPVDSAAVAGILETLADLRASGFPSDSLAMALDFAGTPGALEVYEDDPAPGPPSLALLFLPADNPRDFLVRRGRDPLVFRIPAAVAERLLPERTVLFGATVP